MHIHILLQQGVLGNSLSAVQQRDKGGFRTGDGVCDKIMHASIKCNTVDLWQTPLF